MALSSPGHKCPILIAVIILVHCIFGISGSPNEHEFEQDFVYTFLAKKETMKTTQRMKKAGPNWLADSAYTNAVGITIENWTNHRLEFPEMTLSKGGSDRWYKPQGVAGHFRDIVLIGHGTRGGETQGTVSFLIEDSWPRQWISLGWSSNRSELRIIVRFEPEHASYDELFAKEETSHLVEDNTILYKATDRFVLSVRCSLEGANKLLVVSVVPQNMDYWAWEKYYKRNLVSHQAATVEKVEIMPTKNPRVDHQHRESKDLSEYEEDVIDEFHLQSEPGVFERKELLLPGLSAQIQGNVSDREVLAKMTDSVGAMIRLENWSKFPLVLQNFNLLYGTQSDEYPVASVQPGHVEVFLLGQSGGGSGVSGVFHWRIDENKETNRPDVSTAAQGVDTDEELTVSSRPRERVVSLMLSVPYNAHLWSTWAGIGITQMETVPDFDAMYYGTPDSSWFVRSKTGRRLEFSDGHFTLVMDSDSGTAKPVIRVSLVPIDPRLGAESVKIGIQTGTPQLPTHGQSLGREGDKSVMSSALSSSARTAQPQCFCPCMGASPCLCFSKIIVLMGLFLQLQIAFLYF